MIGCECGDSSHEASTASRRMRSHASSASVLPLTLRSMHHNTLPNHLAPHVVLESRPHITSASRSQKPTVGLGPTGKSHYSWSNGSMAQRSWINPGWVSDNSPLNPRSYGSQMHSSVLPNASLPQPWLDRLKYLTGCDVPHKIAPLVTRNHTLRTWHIDFPFSMSPIPLSDVTRAATWS